MAFDPKTDPVGYRILTAFGPWTPSTSTWRPVFGIAKDSGLSPDVVTGYINEHPQFFERSPLVVSGSELYRPSPKIADQWKVASTMSMRLGIGDKDDAPPPGSDDHP